MVQLNAGKREIWLLAGSLSALTLLFFMMITGGLAAGFAVVWILPVSAAAERELRAIYLDKCSEYGITAGSKLPTCDTVFGYNLSEHMANAALSGVVANLMEGTHP